MQQTSYRQAFPLLYSVQIPGNSLQFERQDLAALSCLAWLLEDVQLNHQCFTVGRDRALLSAVCPWMQGAIELPSEEEMRNQIAKQHELNRRSFAQIERLALLVMLVRPSSCIPLFSQTQKG